MNNDHTLVNLKSELNFGRVFAKERKNDFQIIIKIILTASLFLAIANIIL